MFRSLGQHYTQAELKEMITEIDTDKSGSIEFGEFLQLMVKRERNLDTEEEMVEAFKVFDRDNDGRISYQDLRKVMRQIGDNMSDEMCKEIIASGDTDSDGFLSYDEFIKMMVDKPDKFMLKWEWLLQRSELNRSGESLMRLEKRRWELDLIG